MAEEDCVCGETSSRNCPVHQNERSALEIIGTQEFELKWLVLDRFVREATSHSDTIMNLVDELSRQAFLDGFHEGLCK
jgi:hypothetical protein